MAYSFDFDNRIIDVISPQTDVDVQDLYEACREAEDSLIGIQYEGIVNASGKESLGSGVSIGLTVELLDWQLRFWDGNYVAKIAGGNLVGGIGGDPVAYSPGVQVLLIQSAASTVVQISTGSGLSTEEHDQLMGVVATKTDLLNKEAGLTPEQNTLLSNTATKTDVAPIAFMEQVLKNKRELVKSGSSWYLVVYGDDEITPILRKPLTDVSGSDIVDLIPGVLAREGASLV